MGTLTVLVVDDDVDALVAATTVLTDAGHLCFSATDISQAMEAARRCRPDVVLLDHRLPVQSGLDALDELRAEPALAGARIVLVTASSFAASELAGLDGYLRKPWEPDGLLGCLGDAG